METDLSNADHNVLTGDPNLNNPIDTFTPADVLNGNYGIVSRVIPTLLRGISQASDSSKQADHADIQDNADSNPVVGLIKKDQAYSTLLI